MTSSSRQNTITALESRPCLADVRVNAFPINSPDSQLRHFIFPEASQVWPCGFSMAETSCSQLMFCQAVFFPKPSQEKTHKYSQKQVTYFLADIHFIFCYFHSIFHTYRAHIVIRDVVNMRKLNWYNLASSSKSWAKTCADTFFCWRLEYLGLM